MTASKSVKMTKTLMQTTLQRQPLLLQRKCWLPRLLLRGHFKDSVQGTQIHHLCVFGKNDFVWAKQ